MKGEKVENPKILVSEHPIGLITFANAWVVWLIIVILVFVGNVVSRN